MVKSEKLFILHLIFVEPYFFATKQETLEDFKQDHVHIAAHEHQIRAYATPEFPLVFARDAADRI